ncbi:hypothetical protein C6503_03680 [Candidatus Poribacteria bacterium]|nr:MAG: hypothetical protein C6503_03680 [Candidatus Poribacteria bacterium]
MNLQEVWCYHVLLLSCLISFGCNRSAAPPERQQAEIDKIIKQVAALNAKVDTQSPDTETQIFCQSSQESEKKRKSIC